MRSNARATQPLKTCRRAHLLQSPSEQEHARALKMKPRLQCLQTLPWLAARLNNKWLKSTQTLRGCSKL
jgi:hypothetical protein